MDALHEIKRLTLSEFDFLMVAYAAEKDEFLLTPRTLTASNAYKRIGGGRVFKDGVELFQSTENLSQTAVDWFDQLVETRSPKNEPYTAAAATDFNAVLIHRSWPWERIVFVSQDARDRYAALVSQFEQGSELATTVAEFKLNKIVPKLPSYWVERAKDGLAPYQRVAVFCALNSPTRSYMLTMDRGTGKTPCGVQTVCMLARRANLEKDSGLGVPTPDGGRMIRALIVCPQQVRLNWAREFDKFAVCKGKVSIMRGGVHDRVRKIAEMIAAESGLQFSATICSYDSLVRTSRYAGLVEWDIIITDECHFYKDPRTNRWEEMSQLRYCSKYRLGMSGSPIGNSPMDLWSQLEFLGEGFSGFKSYKAFRRFHGVYENVQGVQGVQKLVAIQNIPLLQERLARLSFSITKDEAGLNLPDKVYSIFEVKMEPYQADVYAKLRDQLALEIEDQLSGAVVDEVTINNILTQLLRLAQVTSGYITYDARRDPHSGEVVTERRLEELCPTNPKFEAVRELLTEERDPRAKTIIWCNFIHNIRLISARLKEMGVVHGCYFGETSHTERDFLVDEFNNNPDFKVLVCNPQTAGEGLNLLGYNLKNPELTDTFCDMEIFFSSNWSAIQRSQAEDRAHRRGTRMPVQVIDLVVPGTIDEEILDKVTSKRKMAATVGDLRGALSRILGQRVVNDS